MLLKQLLNLGLISECMIKEVFTVVKMIELIYENREWRIKHDDKNYTYDEIIDHIISNGHNYEVTTIAAGSTMDTLEEGRRMKEGIEIIFKDKGISGRRPDFYEI